MATPAAVISVLVQARGIAETNRKLQQVHGTSERTAKSTEKLEGRFSRLDNTVGDFNRTFAASGNVMKLVKFPALIAGAGMAAQAVGALGAGAISLGAALAPLSGLGAAAAVGMTAAAQAAGVFKLATIGIAAAVKEQLAVQNKVGAVAGRSAATDTAGAKAVKAAQEGVRQAKEGVRTAVLRVAEAVRGEKFASEDLLRAQDKVRDAQVALTRARFDARRELEDMQASLDDAVLSEQRASINLEEARAELAKVMGDAAATDLDRRKAILGVAEAEDALKDAQRDRTRQETDTAKAQREGIKGSQQVVDAEKGILEAHQDVIDAKRRVRDAERDTTEAKRDLVEAERNVLRATDAVKDAQTQAAQSASGAAAAAANLSAKMNELPGPAQDFVRVLLSLKPKLDELRATAAAGLLPGAGAGLLAAAKNFEAVKGVVGLTASAMGRLAERAGTLVGSSGFGRDLATVGQRNATIIERVGNAAITMGDALRHVVVAAGPLALWLSNLAVKGADWTREQTKAGRESGKLAAFLEQTKAVLQTLGPILANTAAGLFNIAKAGAPLGRDLLGQLEKLTERFREWTESAKGQNAIAAYFRNARGPLLEIVGLAGDIGGALLRLSQSKGATGLIAQMRTLVPIFEKVVASTTAAFGPVLIEALGNFGRLIGALAGSNGPLIMMVKLLSLIAGGLADLLSANPALQTMTVSFIGLYGVWKAMALVFGPLIAGAKALQIALIGEAAAANTAGIANLRARLSLLATGAAMYFASAATAVMTGATWALNAALAVLTSPITLIVVGIAALVAGLVVAYKKSETVRTVLDSLWKALKDVAGAMFDAGKAVVGFLTDIEGMPGKLLEAGKAMTEAIVDGIKSLPGLLAGAAKWLFDTYVAGLKAYLDGWKKLGGWILERIVDGIKAIPGVISAIGGWIKNRVADGLEAVVAGVKGLGGWLLHRIVDGIKAIPDVISAVGGWIKNRIMDGLEAAIEAVKDLGGWIVKRIVDGLKAVPGVLTDLGGWVKNRIKDGLDAAKDGFLDLGGNVIDWIVTGLKGGLNLIVGFVNKIIGVINKIPGVNIKPIAAVATAASGDAAQALAKGGAFARTGGMVTSPITLMGEEAPRHPEFVIPTNPAYRKRAQGLAAQAASAVGVQGFKIGGIFGGLDLPGVGGLPDWLKGTGKWVLGKVGDWVKGLVGGVFDGGMDDIVGGNPAMRIARMVGAMNAIHGRGFPYVYGGGHSPATFDGPYDCSGLVSAILRAGGLMSGSMTTDGLKVFGDAGDGKWVTIGVRGSTGRNAHTMMKIGDRYLESGSGHGAKWVSGWSGGFPIHRHPAGLAKGGLFGEMAKQLFDPDVVGWGLRRGGQHGGLPFLGSYHNGGVATREGLAHVAAGERMTPSGAPTIQLTQHFNGALPSPREAYELGREAVKGITYQLGAPRVREASGL